MDIVDIKNKIENKIVVLSIVTIDNKPHAIAVEVNKAEKNKIIITNNQMKITPENIKNNPCVPLVFLGGENGWRIEGKAEYHDSGKWLNFVKSLKENKTYSPKGAILIKIEQIKEL